MLANVGNSSPSPGLRAAMPLQHGLVQDEMNTRNELELPRPHPRSQSQDLIQISPVLLDQRIEEIRQDECRLEVIYHY